MRRDSLFGALVLVCCACGASTPPQPENDPETSGGEADTRDPEDPDGDGIRGSADLCPETAEDCDGFADLDGCPDRDNDGDFIPDTCDQCPDAPEVRNGRNDEDGCTDSTTADRDVPSWPRVVFEPESATLSREGDTLLDSWVASMRGLEHITQFTIVGSASPGESRPEELAQSRADVVFAALQRKGIESDRLVSSAGRVHDEESEQVDASTRIVNPPSSPAAWLTVSRIGQFDASSRHEPHTPPVPGWAPESMRCPDGSMLMPQPEHLEGAICDAPLTPMSDPVAHEPGSIEVAPMPTATRACRQILSLAYPSLRDAQNGDARIDCVTRYGQLNRDEGPWRSVAVMSIETADTYEPIWLAIAGEEGYRFLVYVGTLRESGSETSDINIDALETRQIFADGPEELWLELELTSRSAEAMPREERTQTTTRHALMMCAWQDRPVCRIVENSEAIDRSITRHHRTRDEHDEHAIRVGIGPDGAIHIEGDGRHRHRLDALLGDYQWPDLPVPGEQLGGWTTDLYAPSSEARRDADE